MNFELRAYAKEDHALLAKWWAAHKWPIVPEDHLPETGLVVEADGKPICAGFLYFTGTAFCVFEFIVADPESEKEARREALDLLIGQAKNLAYVRGARSIFTTAEHQGLIKRYLKHGFKVTDKGMTNMIAGI